jgi:hypothetical protein
MPYRQSASRLIPQRFSCRTYAPEPIGAGERLRIEKAMAAAVCGPLGGRMRFRLIAASTEDTDSLRGLGTYGFIRGATGFLIGALRPSEKRLVDFGYRMEELVLLATDLGLGSCWLGGTFTHSTFADKISLAPEEELPAVVAIGRMAVDPERAKRGPIRAIAGSARRLPWENLFFDGSFSTPLSPEAAGMFAQPLEMVRLGPSASNNQPWRILRTGNDWHFYLQRTPGYRKGFFQRILRLADLQQIDMGIAMCHFGLSVAEKGMRGEWAVREGPIGRSDDRMEYIVTWSGPGGSPAGE